MRRGGKERGGRKYKKEEEELWQHGEIIAKYFDGVHTWPFSATQRVESILHGRCIDLLSSRS
jgi:hypothetical protein